VNNPRFRTLRSAAAFTLPLLAIEFLDEAASSCARSGVFGAREAAWPLIRTDLGLSYAQVGLLLGLPSLVSSIVEPFLGILGDIGRRRVLILSGGVVFALALLLTALSQNFPILLISFIIFYPSSGAFVSLSQATLMDTDPARHEQNMARWTLAGSLGVVAGPIALGAAATLGLGWRGLFLVFAGLTLIPLAMAYGSFGYAQDRFRSAIGQRGSDKTDFKAGLVDVLRALRRGEVLRWLTLLEFSETM
jgi:FSR family fosmidomycin resistance protein-like MFS transporter